MAYMSEEGYQKLVAELKHLESVERPKIVAAIAEARDKGDLSENAEYDAAKERQGFIEGRIKEVEGKLSNAQIIDPKLLDADGQLHGPFSHVLVDRGELTIFVPREKLLEEARNRAAGK